MASWMARAAFTASSGSSNAACMPSPTILTTTPRLASTTVRSKPSCNARACDIRAGCCSHNWELRSMSVNRHAVTLRDGCTTFFSG